MGVTTVSLSASSSSYRSLKLVEECVASVGDEGSEVCSAGQFERQHRGCMVGSQGLEVRSLPFVCDSALELLSFACQGRSSCAAA